MITNCSEEHSHYFFSRMDTSNLVLSSLLKKTVYPLTMPFHFLELVLEIYSGVLLKHIFFSYLWKGKTTLTAQK